MTLEEIKSMQIGETVYARKGKSSALCTVASFHGEKILTFRMNGKLARLKIVDRPGVTYTRGPVPEAESQAAAAGAHLPGPSTI